MCMWQRLTLGDSLFTAKSNGLRLSSSVKCTQIVNRTPIVNKTRILKQSWTKNPEANNGSSDESKSGLKQGRIHDCYCRGRWAGAIMIWAGAVMIWAGAVMIWAGACSNTNFSTHKMFKNAKKSKCDGATERRTDRHGVRDKKDDVLSEICLLARCWSTRGRIWLWKTVWATTPSCRAD